MTAEVAEIARRHLAQHVEVDDDLLLARGSFSIFFLRQARPFPAARAKRAASAFISARTKSRKARCLRDGYAKMKVTRLIRQSKDIRDTMRTSGATRRSCRSRPSIHRMRTGCDRRPRACPARCATISTMWSRAMSRSVRIKSASDAGVERCRRLIENEDIGFANQRTRDRDALLLSDG